MKQISQQTFDECVQENVEDFDMTPEAALEDAIQQFQSQGVDLSNIVKSVASPEDGESPLTQCQSILSQLDQSGLDPNEIEQKLAELQELLTTTTELQTSAGRNGAIQTVSSYLSSSYHLSIIEPAASILCILCAANTDNQDFFGEQGIHAIRSLLDSDSNENTTICRLLILLKNACIKHERNKSYFTKAPGSLQRLLQLSSIAQSDVNVAKAMSFVLRILTITEGDELVVTNANTQETTKRLMDLDILPTTLSLLESYMSNPEVVASWLVVLKHLATTDDNVRKLQESGGLDLLYTLLQHYGNHPDVTRRCASVIRNMAASDDMKSHLFESNVVKELLDGMQRHDDDAQVQQNVCAVIAALALRSPTYSSTLVLELNVASHLTKALVRHEKTLVVVRQASLAIRNIVARSPELCERVWSDPMEQVLRRSQGRRGCGDEAYAALRDLKCDIQLSNYGQHASDKQGFSSLHTESADLQRQMRVAAHAPY